MSRIIRHILAFHDEEGVFEIPVVRSTDGMLAGANPLPHIRNLGLRRNTVMREMKEKFPSLLLKFHSDTRLGGTYLVGFQGFDLLTSMAKDQLPLTPFRSRYYAFCDGDCATFFRDANPPPGVPFPAEIVAPVPALRADPKGPSSPFDQIMHIDDEGEYWLTRELQPIQGYEQWRRFEGVVDDAKAACKANGHNVDYHFAKVGKMVEVGSGATRTVTDYRLTRYACYLVAMGGDGSKPEVAAARNYFAVKTREAELQQDSGSLSRLDYQRLISLTSSLQARLDRLEMAPAILPISKGGPLRHIPPDMNRLVSWAEDNGIRLDREAAKREGRRCARIARKNLKLGEHYVFPQHVFGDDDTPANLYPLWILNLWKAFFIRDNPDYDREMLRFGH